MRNYPLYDVAYHTFIVEKEKPEQTSSKNHGGIRKYAPTENTEKNRCEN